MTDTSTEAVERLAKDCDLARKVMSDCGTFETGQSIMQDAAATLRALSAERDALRADRDQGQRDYCALMERHDAHFVRAEKAEAERDAALARAERAEAVLRRLRHQITEASHPDFLFGALDNVHDMDTGLPDYAAAASRAIRAACGLNGGTDE
jgi:chromosome segregation ATPase